MVFSMTGFGQAEGETSFGNLRVEIRSLNHRFLEINLKLPKWATLIEGRIREVVKEHVKRGKVDVVFYFERNKRKATLVPTVQWELIENFINTLKEVKERFAIKDDIALSHLLQYGLIYFEEPEGETDIWDEVEPIVRKALLDLSESRRKEGENMQRDMLSRVHRMEEALREMEEEASGVPYRLKEKILKRIKELTQGLELDTGRLELEVALLVQRSDITEELTRLKGHLQSLREKLQKGGIIGRALDFLLQEVYREANTIASKAPELGIIQKALLIKEEAEKVREQAQNVE